jgi:hypothetical protein
MKRLDVSFIRKYSQELALCLIEDTERLAIGRKNLIRDDTKEACACMTPIESAALSLHWRRLFPARDRCCDFVIASSASMPLLFQSGDSLLLGCGRRLLLGYLLIVPFLPLIVSLFFHQISRERTTNSRISFISGHHRTCLVCHLFTLFDRMLYK